MTGKTKTRRRERTMEELASAPWLSLQEAARVLNLSAASLRRAYQRGELKAHLLGCALRLWRRDLDMWVEGQRWTPALCAERTARPRAGRRKARKPALPAGPVSGQEAPTPERVSTPTEGLS
jgi:excisionase family DNA binding protein